MDLIHDKWNKEQCRFEDGIFFSNDEYIALNRDLNNNFHARPRMSVQSLMDEEPNGWTFLFVFCEFTYGETIVVGGSGSQEGDGFVAVVGGPNQDLQWLLHLKDIEGVRQLTVEKGVIHAVAIEYPNHYTLAIPLEEPQNVSMIHRHEL